MNFHQEVFIPIGEFEGLSYKIKKAFRSLRLCKKEQKAPILFDLTVLGPVNTFVTFISHPDDLFDLMVPIPRLKRIGFKTDAGSAG